MGNKLSELSKPAWIVGQQEIADFMRGDEALLVRGHNPESTEPALRMYSQEYVSALLAELEAKKKHIADMENVVAAAKCDDELWDAMAHRLKILEDKLATPVRLPPLMDGELCGKYGAKYGAAANAHNNAITACSIAIRGAGFKSEATALKCVGDE